MNLAALSLNYRDYPTAEENFRAVLKAQPNNYDAAIGLGVALRGNRKFDEAEQQYLTAQKLNPQGPDSYFNLGLLYQEYKTMDKTSLQKAQQFYRDFLGRNAVRPEAQGGRKAHQGHRRHDGCPGRSRQDAERGGGDAEEDGRAAEGDGRGDEEDAGAGEAEQQRRLRAAPRPAAAAARRWRGWPRRRCRRQVVAAVACALTARIPSGPRAVFR